MIRFPFLAATILALATALPLSAGAATLKTIYAIKNSGDGNAPNGGLINVNGTLYGTTSGGGTYGLGTVFTINAATGAEATLYAFKGGTDGANPAVALLNVGGTLYGTTQIGGTANAGTVFKINPATGAEAILHSFAGGSDGANPLAALIDVNGTLYGTTLSGGGGGGGTVYTINPTTGAEAVLYAFKNDTGGAFPSAALLNVSGTLYGTVAGGTSVFAINPTTGAESIVGPLGLGATVGVPTPALINVDGKIYATVQGSGTYPGKILSFDLATGRKTLLHEFSKAICCKDGKHPASAMLNFGGNFYGTTTEGGASASGTVYSYNPATGTEKVVYSFTSHFKATPDGSYPAGDLIEVNGIIYGTTQAGGPGPCSVKYIPGCGTVFSFNPATGAKTIVHSFTGATYATTASALPFKDSVVISASLPSGAAGMGEIVKLNPVTGAVKWTYAFTGGSDGSAPYGALVNLNGTLYGTTQQGGSTTNFCPAGCGTVFAINATTGAEKILYAFQGGGSDGNYPLAGLVNINGTLYGTTRQGGLGVGTVFAINPTTGAEKVVYVFNNTATDGAFPEAALINVAGTLYGTTPRGGTGYSGTIFSINPATGAETVLYAFTGASDGSQPVAALLNIGGTLYGTTFIGGTGTCYNSLGCGTVFSFNPVTGTKKTLYAFTGGNDGAGPITPLINVNGTLQGTTHNGGLAGCGTGCGTIFTIDPATGTESTRYTFTGAADGGNPNAIVNAAGTTYGTTSYAQLPALGAVFSLKP